MALLQNARLSVLKLGYNNLGCQGVKTLAVGIKAHRALQSLDLGFNHIGDDGCQALAQALVSLPQSHCSLRTLYLAGNLFGEDGAMALGDVIRHGCSLQKLHLTGNRLGPEGVKAVVEAIVEAEQTSEKGGITDLFLGGTGMGQAGCHAVAHMLQRTRSIRVISLANCDIGDEELAVLASSIKENREKLPLETLQLSFNNITCKGLDSLTNAIWGSRTLRELLLDNNEIGDRGGQQIANILPHVKTLQVLDVGFNMIKSNGMRTLMKVVAETQHLTSLSVSGNAIDTGAAKAVAFALAYNRSLKSLFLDHCHIEHEGQRHIVAGFVSNSGIALRKLTGFRIGRKFRLSDIFWNLCYKFELFLIHFHTAVIVTIGLPESLEHWTNEQVLNFIHLMWEQSNEYSLESEEERELDPLHFLSDPTGETGKVTGPLDANTVVDVAKRAFASLGETGQEVFSRIQDCSGVSSESPLAEDAIMVEGSRTDPGEYKEMANGDENRPIGKMLLLSNPAKSFVAAPEQPAESCVPDPSRKKRIVDWLCQNIQHLNDLSQLPFSSGEMFRLHQHYFTPVVNECGGDFGHSDNSGDSLGRIVNSVPEWSRGIAAEVHASVTPSTQSSDIVPVSDPSLPASSPGAVGTSLPMLKRKVSYRFLGDAVVPTNRPSEAASYHSRNGAVAKMIEDGSGVGHSMPPKTKRARRNKTRISFLPRIKGKLDSHLDVCHEKALILMRQLHFVESAHLNGKINPIDPASPTTHLSGVLASEAEMILVDMM